MDRLNQRLVCCACEDLRWCPDRPGLELEKSVLCPIEFHCEVLGASPIRMEHLHEPSMGFIDLRYLGAGSESENRQGLAFRQEMRMRKLEMSAVAVAFLAALHGLL